MIRRRDRNILKCRAKGFTVAEIAKRYRMHPRSIQKILARVKQVYTFRVKASPSDLAKSA